MRVWLLATMVGLLTPGLVPAAEIRLSVVDAGSGDRLAARVYLQDSAGKSHYFASATPRGTAVKYEKQNWINAKSVEYHTTVSPHAALAEVPEGQYRLTVERGQSHFPHTQDVVVSDEDVEVTVSLRRWNDPAARGWYSGDTHLHRTIAELRNVIVAEDLNVALPLTNWVTTSATPPAAGDKNQAEIPQQLVVVDRTHVIWPRSTEYEIFSVGEQRHTLGALFVLGHRDALKLGVPPWGPVVEAVQQSDPQALFELDKLDWPFSMVLPTLAPQALYELSNNHVWRTEFAFREWNSFAPAYLQPPFGARVGGHREWIDYTLGMYYTLLNCGFRLPPTAGTANGVHPVPAGFGRVYVHLPDGFSYAGWMEGLRSGRSFVTTGPMLFGTAGGHDPGHVFQVAAEQTVPLELELLSEHEIAYGELVVNGRPEMLLRAQNEPTSAGAHRSVWELPVKLSRSGWFAIRCWEPRPDGQSRFVHSAPWYVEVAGQPVRPLARERKYLVARMESEIERSQDIVSPAALREYERALAYYRALPAYDDSAEVRAQARAATGADLQQWLDNMILDHAFTAQEIRLATGISTVDAERAIAARADRARPTGVRIRPYPGGRHPRRGFLDGAIRPQRETKVSIFPPWENGGYVVVDVPEAIFSNLGLTYLAHAHIPTIWGDEALQRSEWRVGERTKTMSSRRELPNGIRFKSFVTVRNDGADMRIMLTNKTDDALQGLRVQVCTMLKGAVGFQTQEALARVIAEPYVAVRAPGTRRWIITGWEPLHRVWTNPPVPCVHADPIFPDCAPGQTVWVDGGLWFYEGDDVREKLQSLKISKGPRGTWE